MCLQWWGKYGKVEAEGEWVEYMARDSSTSVILLCKENSHWLQGAGFEATGTGNCIKEPRAGLRGNQGGCQQ